MQSDANENADSALSPKQEVVALLLAQAELTQTEIARQNQVDIATIWRWKKKPEFSARVTELATEIRAAIRERGIAILENRVQAAQDRWERMQRLIEARSQEHMDVPGGETGLIVHNVKSIGSGITAERVDLYEFDAALVKEMREHERQVAEELGQWKADAADDRSGDVMISMRPVKHGTNTDNPASPGDVQPPPSTGSVP